MPGQLLVPVEPAMSFGPTTALVWVLLFGSCVTLPLAFAIRRFFVFRGRSLRAQSIQRTPARLEAGPALLRGRVETEDRSPAVRIEIDQVGTERSHKGTWSHTWTERNRAVHVRPFRLRIPGEEIVHVVPDERIRLVDTLETEKYEAAYRRRVAELVNGEPIWVSGELAQERQKGGPSTAYRSGPGSWVLRGSRMEPLEVASGSLERQFSYWEGFYRKAVLVLGVVFLLVHVVLLGPYYALFWLGRVETVQVTDTSTFITSNKGRTTTHYVVHGKLSPRAGSRAVADEVSWWLYYQAKEGMVKTVPFLYVPSATWIHAIGSSASLSYLRGFLALIAGLLTAILHVVIRRSAMPWYEQKVVIERGQGTLTEKAWYAQEPGRPGLFVARTKAGSVFGSRE